MDTFERFFKSGSFKGNTRTRLKLRDNRNELIDDNNNVDSDSNNNLNEKVSDDLNNNNDDDNNNSNDNVTLLETNNTNASNDVLKELIDEETGEDIDNEESSSVWIEVLDEESGLSYYWNTETNETTSLGDPKPETYSFNEEDDVEDNNNKIKKKKEKKKDKKAKKRSTGLEIIEESSEILLQVIKSTEQIQEEISNCITSSNVIDTLDNEINIHQDSSIGTVIDDDIDNNKNNEKLDFVDAINYDTKTSIIDTETSIEVIQTIEMTETPINGSIYNNNKISTLKKDFKKIYEKETDSNIKSRRKNSFKSNSIKISPPKQKSIKINNSNKGKERKRGLTTFFVDIFKSVVGNSFESCVNDKKVDKSIENEFSYNDGFVINESKSNNNNNEYVMIEFKSTNNEKYVINDNNISIHIDKQEVETKDEEYNEKYVINDNNASIHIDKQEVETKDEEYNENDVIIEGIASYPPLLEYSEFDIPSDIITTPIVKVTIERCKICTLPIGTCKHTNIQNEKINGISETITNSIKNSLDKGKISYPSIKKSSKKVDDDYIDFAIDEEALSINWYNDQLKIKNDLLTVIVSSFDLNDGKTINTSISDKTNDDLIKELNNTIQDKFLSNSNVDDIRQAAINFRHITKQDKLKINLQNDLQLKGPLCNYPIISSPKYQKSSTNSSPIQKRSKNIIGHSTCLTYIPKTNLH